MNKHLHAALQKVFDEVGHVSKQRIRELGYSVLSEKAVLAEIKPKFSEYGLHLGPVKVELADTSTWTSKKGTVFNRVVIIVTYRLWHAESGEHEDFQVIGEASDTSDKSCAKATTISQKHLLRQLAMVESGDDPDMRRPEAGPAAKPASEPVKPAAKPTGKPATKPTANGAVKAANPVLTAPSKPSEARAAPKRITEIKNLILLLRDPSKAERSIVERRKLFKLEELTASDADSVFQKLTQMTKDQVLCEAATEPVKN